MAILENDALRVEIGEAGAELRSVRTRADAAEWLWQGDAAWWTGRAPLLFPVVGQSPAGHVSIAGRRHPMLPHGFARGSRFRQIAAEADRACFALLASDETRASFPFDFELIADCVLEGQGLRFQVRIENRDRRPMPCQFGFHPAFNWPLGGDAAGPHRIRFLDRAPDHALRPAANGLIDPRPRPLRIEAGVMAMDAADYAEGALVFPGLGARRIRFEAEDRAVEMAVENLPDFALWQKPGAPYLCLEPWCGTAPFVDQGDALEARPGVMVIGAGEAPEFAMRLRFERRQAGV